MLLSLHRHQSLLQVSVRRSNRPCGRWFERMRRILLVTLSALLLAVVVVPDPGDHYEYPWPVPAIDPIHPHPQAVDPLDFDHDWITCLTNAIDCLYHRRHDTLLFHTLVGMGDIQACTCPVPTLPVRLGHLYFILRYCFLEMRNSYVY